MTKLGSVVGRAAVALSLAVGIAVVTIAPAHADWHHGQWGHWGWRGGTRVFIVAPYPYGYGYPPGYYYAPPPPPVYYAPPPPVFVAPSFGVSVRVR